MAVDANLEISQKLQERFEFYVIALTFTILGLSIQTAKFGAHLAPDALELLGWVFLFVSGVIGLWRFERLPLAYKLHAELRNVQSEVAQLHQARQGGQTEIFLLGDQKNFPLNEVIASRAESVGKLKLKEESLEKWVRHKYKIHKWTFVGGLLFLLTARAYEPVSGIVGAVCAAMHT